MQWKIPPRSDASAFIGQLSCILPPHPLLAAGYWWPCAAWHHLFAKCLTGNCFGYIKMWPRLGARWICRQDSVEHICSHSSKVGHSLSCRRRATSVCVWLLSSSRHAACCACLKMHTGCHWLEGRRADGLGLGPNGLLTLCMWAHLSFLPFLILLAFKHTRFCTPTNSWCGYVTASGHISLVMI